jgi:hypothetical protein
LVAFSVVSVPKNHSDSYVVVWVVEFIVGSICAGAVDSHPLVAGIFLAG